jgi:hypothetical protein
MGSSLQEATMGQAIFWAVIAVAFLAVIYLSRSKKDGFVQHFSRGAYMLELNKKMEAENEKKSP